MSLTRLVPLSEAAARLHKKAADLFDLDDVGKIKLAMNTTTGEYLMSEVDIQAQLPREEQPEYKHHAHLKGVGIGIGDGARKYGINHGTISRWVKEGYIASLGSTPVRGGYKVLIDEADLAYCIEIYNRDRGQGKRVFAPTGLPYQKK
jgi:hypothetical protein